MKILILNESDIEGGAARAAGRLHDALLKRGADAKMLVQLKKGDHPAVIGPTKGGKLIASLRPKLDTYPLHLWYKTDRLQLFSPAWMRDSVGARVRGIAPDLVHLHWLNNGFVRPESLAGMGRPLVWTLHDMWPFTGGCHYDGECGRYREGCGRCPQLSSAKDRDLSVRILERKRKAYQGLPLTIVTPSRWLAECARASALFRNLRVEVIPNGLDLERYRPMDKAVARDILGIPRDKDIILFGAMSVDDKRKGFQHLQPALRKLSAHPAARNTELVVFGSGRPASPPDLGLPIRYLGRLHDDISLSLLYAAADVFVSPSVQDNLPNTVMEAMACGTPCVSFRIGGMEDMIDHGRNGWLAAPFDAGELADGMLKVISEKQRCREFSLDARRKAESLWGLERFAKNHLDLYSDLIKARAPA